MRNQHYIQGHYCHFTILPPREIPCWNFFQHVLKHWLWDTYVYLQSIKTLNQRANHVNYQHCRFQPENNVSPTRKHSSYNFSRIPFSISSKISCRDFFKYYSPGISPWLVLGFFVGFSGDFYGDSHNYFSTYSKKFVPGVFQIYLSKNSIQGNSSGEAI